MSKKDYVLIASILKSCRALGYNYDTLNMICMSFGTRLSKEDATFDCERFFIACGMKE